MSQALVSRTAERSPRGPERTQIAAMTCDIPVVDGRTRRRRPLDREMAVCRPTGRAPRRTTDAGPRPRGTIRGADRRVAYLRGAEIFEHRTGATRASRSNIDAVVRRRRFVGALAVGAVLAGVVWVLAIVGAGYEDAATPSTPGSTQVVHVRTGESLSDVAQRIAPDLPVAGVVEQIRELNHLNTSGLRVSQPLVAPAY